MIVDKCVLDKNDIIKWKLKRNIGNMKKIKNLYDKFLLGKKEEK